MRDAFTPEELNIYSTITIAFRDPERGRTGELNNEVISDVCAMTKANANAILNDRSEPSAKNIFVLNHFESLPR